MVLRIRQQNSSLKTTAGPQQGWCTIQIILSCCKCWFSWVGVNKIYYDISLLWVVVFNFAVHRRPLWLPHMILVFPHQNKTTDNQSINQSRLIYMKRFSAELQSQKEIMLFEIWSTIRTDNLFEALSQLWLNTTVDIQRFRNFSLQISYYQMFSVGKLFIKITLIQILMKIVLLTEFSTITRNLLTS